jgi:hypothetical protein
MQPFAGFTLKFNEYFGVEDRMRIGGTLNEETDVGGTRLQWCLCAENCHDNGIASSLAEDHSAVG